MKQFEEFRKLTTAQGVDYTTECLLDYYYIKTQHRLIAIDLRRQKELDADRKTIQKIAFVGQLKNPDYEIAANESVFVLTILQKFKETWLKFFQGSETVLQKMTNYQKSAAKKKDWSNIKSNEEILSR